jgi:hypothetical protein
MIFSEDYWKDESEGQRVAAVSTGLSWKRMSPLLEAAETDYLRPLLGDTLTEEVDGIYWNGREVSKEAAKGQSVGPFADPIRFCR